MLQRSQNEYRIYSIKRPAPTLLNAPTQNCIIVAEKSENTVPICFHRT